MTAGPSLARAIQPITGGISAPRDHTKPRHKTSPESQHDSHLPQAPFSDPVPFHAESREAAASFGGNHDANTDEAADRGSRIHYRLHQLMGSIIALQRLLHSLP